MSAEALFAGIVGAFAVLVTTHVAIVVGLARRRPAWYAAAALAAPPLARYWALRERMRARAILWITAAVIYLLILGMQYV